MPKHILITGGAGFIGSHLTQQLIAKGHQVRILDSLIPQVHGDERRRPGYLHPAAELMVGDVRDRAALRRALQGVQVVFHLAARVGVGQSMYEIAEYVSVNTAGTALLLEELVQKRVERLVVASSMSIYGEGEYQSSRGESATPVERSPRQLRSGEWEVRSASGDVLTPVATRETKVPALSSIYAQTKYDQERMCLIAGQAYEVPTVALRFFNAYGPNQALSNPYTGVLAIFASRVMNGRPPLINEDGRQLRDFVSVHDVARACCLAMENAEAPGNVFNVGSGIPYSVLDIAREVARTLNADHIRPEVTGRYRSGDIRHCYADLTHARDRLGYQPQVTLEAGLADLAKWLHGQKAHDLVAESRAELAQRGLIL